ncbi:hypothetical protein IWQ62_001665 [Dispira parvispora]|uniref:AB hydrolase-1 domain-containing protein n=1 Tax=Dispira parvispora TaxID=1520584 RepID=A0A9W8AUH6_9FUNG|nr:hypothetical protein IWQ62_001665 [Dispira parvispora]
MVLFFKRSTLFTRKKKTLLRVNTTPPTEPSTIVHGDALISPAVTTATLKDEPRAFTTIEHSVVEDTVLENSGTWNSSTHTNVPSPPTTPAPTSPKIQAAELGLPPSLSSGPPETPDDSGDIPAHVRPSMEALGRFFDSQESTTLHTSGYFEGNAQRKKPARLYYELHGTGPRKLLLIMGLNGTTSFWKLQTEFFGKLDEYQVCVFDNRGIGKSELAPGPYSVYMFAKDSLDLLNHLGWSQDVHVAGVSLGGMIAQRLVLMDPGRFDTATLVSTYHSSVFAMPTIGDIRFFLQSLTGSQESLTHQLLRLCFSKKWLNSPFTPTNTDFHPRGTSTVVPTPPDSNAASLPPPSSSSSSPPSPSRMTTNHDMLLSAFEMIKHQTPPSKERQNAELSQLQATWWHNLTFWQLLKLQRSPVRLLVMHGSKDKVIRSGCGRALARFLQCPFDLFVGSGHMIMLDNHEKFNRDLLAHMEHRLEEESHASAVNSDHEMSDLPTIFTPSTPARTPPVQAEIHPPPPTALGKALTFTQYLPRPPQLPASFGQALSTSLSLNTKRTTRKNQ